MATALLSRFDKVAWGRVWFKWRGVSPVPFLLAMMVLPAERPLSPRAFFFWMALAAVGEGVRLWAVGYMGSATRTRGEGVPDLVHAGPLRFVRNPLYLANVTLYVSLGQLLGHPTLSAWLLLYSAFQYTCIVAFEEERLKEIFGEAYLRYQEKVGRWAPAFRPLVPSSGHPYRFWAAVRSERSTLLLIAVGLTVVLLRRYL